MRGAQRVSVEKGQILAGAGIPSMKQVALAGYMFCGWYDSGGNKLGTGVGAGKCGVRGELREGPCGRPRARAG